MTLPGIDLPLRGYADLVVADEERDADLARLAGIVSPTLRVMDAMLAWKLDPVPTQAPMTLCGNCPWRRPCSRWGAATRRAATTPAAS